MKRPEPLPMDIRLMQLTSQMLLVLAVTVCLTWGLAWLARLPMFALQAITVEGEGTRNNALTLRTNVVPKLSGNFFTIELDQVREAFEAVPWVRVVIVHREFPNRLRVHLLEQQPAALWGDEGSSQMVNQQGEVFEANLGEVEADALPRLMGPASASGRVLEMYRQLQAVLAASDMDIERLELSPGGSWRLLTHAGAVIELGRGEIQEVRSDLQQFLRTLPQVAARYGRTPKALAAADLRHKDGYALRLHGVSTTEGDPRRKS